VQVLDRRLLKLQLMLPSIGAATSAYT
jgi:hypothetical protein